MFNSILEEVSALNILDKLCRGYLQKRGYAVPRHAADDMGDYVLARYQDRDGRFDYDRYVSVQTAGNRAKINKVWADEQTIGMICDYLRSTGAPLRHGLCHGSRNGAEVKWFQDRLGIEVIGTDISDTASEYGLVQWDFHKTNPEWVGQFDFVYTNAHDHAHDPELAFSTWVDQLSPSGKLIVEHTDWHGAAAVTELDPFGVSPKLFPYVVLGFAKGRYSVTRLLQPDHFKAKKSQIWVFVIERVAALSQVAEDRHIDPIRIARR